MGKRVLYLLVVLSCVMFPRVTRASSVASRNRPRCSQTSGAFLERIIQKKETGEAFLEDASHLLPHLEIGYVPLGGRATDKDAQVTAFHHMTFAVKPSLSACLIEAHLTAEAILGSDDVEETKKGNSSHVATSFGWRIGAEGFTRPSRWLPDEWRIFDAIGIGFGATIGGIATSRYPMIGVDKAVEIGPRLLFDVNEWLGFVIALNLHVRPPIAHEQAEFGGVFHGAIQLSFPSHAFTDDHHEHH